MADGVVFISNSDSEGSRSPPPLRYYRQLPPVAEIIDLTCEDTRTDGTPWSSLTIIDLTEDTCSPPNTTSWAEQEYGQVPVTPAAHTDHSQLCSTKVEETEETVRSSSGASGHNAPMELSATSNVAESTEIWSGSSYTSKHHILCHSPEQNCSTTTFNSDLGSLAYMPTLSPSSLVNSSSCKASGPEKETPHLCQQRELSPRLSPARAIPTTPGKAQGSLLEAGDLPPHKTIQQVIPARTKNDSKAWLNKLYYFRTGGVQHLFLNEVSCNRETEQQPELIPSRKLKLVHTTMEENFTEGTLHFLNEFVSHQYCPPKDIISYLIRQILLNPHQGGMLKDTYMLLMKIQMLHPANTTTLGWDWMLLRYIMEDQEKPPGRLLFLQYVVQTLEDDFQQNLSLSMLHKSIAKKMLSCDTCFSNVKEVVEWLVAAATGVGFSQFQEKPQEATSSTTEGRDEHGSSALQLASTDHTEMGPPAFFAQKTMLLLQRMLSLAVEVDKFPNCSSCKIADVIFPFILSIPLRIQREAFLTTMDSQLLRCKLLELLFQHSCEPSPTILPLSLTKILYFVSHCSVLLPYQGETATWQRWDEMLQYLSLLLLSYQNVILEDLQSSLSDRMEMIVQKAKPKLQDSDYVSQGDIQLTMENLISRLQQILGQPLPLQITEKLFMLQELFLILTTT